MQTNTDFSQRQAGDLARLRSQLETLRARYDCGAVAPSMYAVIVDLEIEIAWLQHRRVRP